LIFTGAVSEGNSVWMSAVMSAKVASCREMAQFSAKRDRQGEIAGAPPAFPLH
jgi:hypothetical protein